MTCRLDDLRLVDVPFPGVAAIHDPHTGAGIVRADEAADGNAAGNNGEPDENGFHNAIFLYFIIAHGAKIYWFNVLLIHRRITVDAPSARPGPPANIA